MTYKYVSMFTPYIHILYITVANIKNNVTLSPPSYAGNILSRVCNHHNITNIKLIIPVCSHKKKYNKKFTYTFESLRFHISKQKDLTISQSVLESGQKIKVNALNQTQI